MWASAPTQEAIEPRRKSGAGPGGHTGRPYEKTGRRVCRGGFYIRPRAPVCRMHHRRPHSVGADAHIGPPGIDIKSTIAERTPRRGAHRASGTDLKYTGPVVDAPGSGRIYNPPLRRREGVCVRRTALHPEPGGPMWASAPTRETIEPRRKSGAGPGGHTGRPYEKTGRRVCRGGFYIRPRAPVCRMHHRRPHSVGADAHIGPFGIGIISAIAERTP